MRVRNNLGARSEKRGCSPGELFSTRQATAQIPGRPRALDEMAQFSSLDHSKCIILSAD
jgi:hypothetical protein